MKPSSAADFNKNYQRHLQHLRVKGLQPKTISAYSRAIRRIGDYFNHQILDLSEAHTHLTSHTHQNAYPRINDLMSGFSISWGGVK